MAKYRIPRDTDVEGDLTVFTGLDVVGTTDLHNTDIDGNATISGDLTVTGDIVTTGSVVSESTTKSLSTDVQVSLLHIIVNDDTATDPISGTNWTVHVPETIETLEIDLTAPTTHDMQVYITNTTGERKDLDVRYRAERVDKGIRYTVPAGLTAINPITSIGSTFLLDQDHNSYASYRISYRNANLADEVERLVHPDTIPTYRDDRNIEASFCTSRYDN